MGSEVLISSWINKSEKINTEKLIDVILVELDDKDGLREVGEDDAEWTTRKQVLDSTAAWFLRFNSLKQSFGICIMW